jgi:uncharacterized phage protein gp47/JayE
MPRLQQLLSQRVSKSLDQIRSELFARIEEVQDEYAAKGWLPARLNLNKGVARGLLELFCWGVWQLYRLLETVLYQAFPRYATGQWQDAHSEQIGNDRVAASQTQGKVLFLRNPANTGNVRIPAGRIVRTRPDGLGNVYRYVTLADAVLPVGADFVGVLSKAEEYGALANAGPGQIRELVPPVDGISGVTNEAGWLVEEGADEETDAAMQRRYALSWEALGGVISAKYKAVALGVKGVVDVAIADQHPRGEGTIDIIVKGSAGLPTDSLLQAVAAAIDAEIVINHDRLVKGPTPVYLDAILLLELLSGDEAASKLAAENHIRAVFSGSNPGIEGLAIGQDVIRDRLAAGIITMPGVKRIIWGADLADGDIAIPVDGLAMLRSLDVQSTWVSEA